MLDDARTLLAISTHGTLSTLDARTGHPYGSLVELSPEPDGSVSLLLSTLAQHTTNLDLDARASILVQDPFGEHAPLSSARLCLIGALTRLDEPGEVRERFLALHPGASNYVDFKDFAFFSLRPERVRYVGGFGRMDWFESEQWPAGTPDPLAPAVRGIVEHMNEDHAYNLLDYARAFTGHSDAKRARMIGVDSAGFSMLIWAPSGTHTERVEFDSPATSAALARKELVRMAREARATLGEDDA